MKTALTSLTTGRSQNSEALVADQQEKCVGSARETGKLGKGQSSQNLGNGAGNRARNLAETPTPEPFLRTGKEDKDYEPTLEALGGNWRRSLNILPRTKEYLEVARQPFEDSQVERVAEMGARLVLAAGGFVEAGKKFKRYA